MEYNLPIFPLILIAFCGLRIFKLQVIILLCFLLEALHFSLKFFLLIPERGKGRKREEEKHEHERETSTGCLSHTPQLGTEPATQACALTGNPTCDPLVCEMMPNQLGYTGPGYILAFKKFRSIIHLEVSFMYVVR